jgi:ABC-type amino acid transport substrate-binding protein
VVSLHLGATAFPPFSDAAGQPRFALDLVTSALQRSGYVVNIQMVPEGTLTAALREGQLDGSPTLWRSPDREEFLLYSIPYLENRLMLVGKKGSAVDAASFAALAGKKIGIVAGYAYGPELEAAKEPVFVKAKNTEDNFRALLHGDIDYVLEDALVIHHLVQGYPEKTQQHLSVGKKALVTRTLHFAVRKSRPDAESIIEAFNRQLAHMLADGSYHRALDVEWIGADMDGDGKLELVAGGEKVGAKKPEAGYQLMSVAPAGSGGAPVSDAGKARIVIKGISYDSWESVPDDYKEPASGLGNKPRTLRLQVFEF